MQTFCNNICDAPQSLNAFEFAGNSMHTCTRAHPKTAALGTAATEELSTANKKAINTMPACTNKYQESRIFSGDLTVLNTNAVCRFHSRQTTAQRLTRPPQRACPFAQRSETVRGAFADCILATLPSSVHTCHGGSNIRRFQFCASKAVLLHPAAQLLS